MIPTSVLNPTFRYSKVRCQCLSREEVVAIGTCIREMMLDSRDYTFCNAFLKFSGI